MLYFNFFNKFNIYNKFYKFFSKKKFNKNYYIILNFYFIYLMKYKI